MTNQWCLGAIRLLGLNHKLESIKRLALNSQICWTSIDSKVISIEIVNWPIILLKKAVHWTVSSLDVRTNKNLYHNLGLASESKKLKLFIH